ncbi:MAG: radical SAM family heme chaperone HemW [Parvibaculales bacterium]
MSRGVYVHWPFCAAICPYCDFNVHLDRGVDGALWAEAFETEIRSLATRIAHQPVDTVFFGGGTPSLMPPFLVERIIAALDGAFGLAPGAEISLEANPAGLNQAAMQALRSAGVTRLSLGIQSFDDAQLSFLGRTHTGVEAVASYELARQVFNNVSFDLIYALPEQTPEMWAHHLDEALALAPDHVSAYQLTIEPRTPFFKRQKLGRLTLPDEDRQAALFEVTHQACVGAGYEHYEVSNFAQPGRRCRHNLNIWRGAEYIGLGPGAHGRVAFQDTPCIRQASLNHKKPDSWLAAVKQDGTGLDVLTPLTPQECGEEALLFGLRLSEGLPLTRLEGTGVNLDTGKIGLLRAEGLCEMQDNVLRLTDRGRLVLDSMVSALLS